MLEGYPLAKKYLDYDQLNLQSFLPGSVIFTKRGKKTIGDPLRHFPFLIPTLFSGIGTFGDKLKILKLNKALKNKSTEEIFTTPEKSTLNYLKDFGFSEQMISNFFQPFFTGIFLETALDTSSRMFEFVYKMFGEGNAAIPMEGIAAIPAQLVEKLKMTTILYGQNVQQVTATEIHLEGGETIAHEGAIIAGEASHLIQNMKNQVVEWKGCDCLYFETPDRVISKALIGLIANPYSLINNIVYVNQVKSNNDRSMLSVTVVKSHELSEEELVETVRHELNEWCGITETTFIRRYELKKALPKNTNLAYNMHPSETQLFPTVFLAGDYMLYGSLNAAIQSGESAALGLMEKLEDHFGL